MRAASATSARLGGVSSGRNHRRRLSRMPGNTIFPRVKGDSAIFFQPPAPSAAALLLDLLECAAVRGYNKRRPRCGGRKMFSEIK